jgi:hypothetical protein
MANSNAPWPPTLDREARMFGERLAKEKYDGAVDPLGWVRWSSEWRMHRANGRSVEEAWALVSAAIDAVRAGRPQAQTPPGEFDAPWPPVLDTDAPVFAVVLEDLYRTEHPQAPQPVDALGWVRWSSDYRLHRANGLTHDAAWSRIANAIRGIWRVTVPIEPTPRPDLPPHRVPAGGVRIDNRTFVDQLGPFLGGVISYFHGVRTFAQNLPRFDEDARTMAAAGADGARVISDLGWPVINGVNKEWNGPANIEALVAMIDHLFDGYGIRTQLTLLGSLMGATFENGRWEKAWPYRLDNQPARLRYADNVCAALRGREHKLLLIEVCNEPENGAVGPLSRPDQAELQQRMQQRLPTVLVCLGAPGGEHGVTTWDGEDYRWYGEHGAMVLPHLDRGRRDCVENGFATSGAGAAYGHIHQGIHSAQDAFAWGNNEPIGPRSSNAEESDPTRLRMAATATWMCKGAYHCYHPYSGISLAADSDYPIAREPGILNVFDARRVLPTDLPNFRFHNWHWTSNPFEAIDGCLTDQPGRSRGAIRNLAMTADRRRVIQIIKVGANGASYRMREPLRLTRYEHDGTAYQPRDERDFNAGEILQLPAAEEYLFIGEAK